MALTVYCTSWCGYCHRLTAQLERAGIGFIEIDIETDPAAADYVKRVNGGNHTVPTVRFADGTTLVNPTITEVRTHCSEVATRC